MREASIYSVGLGVRKMLATSVHSGVEQSGSS